MSDRVPRWNLRSAPVKPARSAGSTLDPLSRGVTRSAGVCEDPRTPIQSSALGSERSTLDQNPLYEEGCPQGGVCRNAHAQASALGSVRATSAGLAAFTLVEVLVGLGIFAMAAVVLGAAYVNILVNYQAMRAWSSDREELAYARASVLAEPDRTKAERGGEIALLTGGNLRWKATIADLPRADLFQVTLDLEVAPLPPAPARREKQVFVLLRPTWSDAAQREKLRAAFRESLAKRQF